MLTAPLSRAEQMSRIRWKNTDPEIRLRSALWRIGLRYRLHAETPAGRPDVVFPGKQLAVFIDGCFWHGCPKHYVRPRSRAEFWASKLLTNVERDRTQTLELEARGWRVVRVWEHEVYENLEEVVRRIQSSVRGRDLEAMPDWRVFRVDEIDEVSRQERRYLQQLRCPEIRQVEEGRRITTKWRRSCDT